MVVNNRETGQELIPHEIRNESLEKKKSVQRTKEELGGRKGNI